MRARRSVSSWLWVGAVAGCLAASPARAEDKGKKAGAAASAPADKGGKKAEAAKAQEQLPEDIRKAIEAKQKSAEPGPMHDWMKLHLAGNWNVEVLMFVPGKTDPVKSQGTESCRPILGDRFIACEYSGNVMGREMIGQRWFAYDNQRKRFAISDIDTFGTEMLQIGGTLDEASQVLTTTGTLFSTQQQKEVTARYVFRFENHDRFVEEFWAPGPDGKETKRREVIATRKK